MPSAKSRVLEGLRTYKPEVFVSELLLDRTPYFFNGASRRYAGWCRALAQDLGVDPADLAVVGSAATGVSLNPTKAFKVFDGNSDIDVAVISSHHFEESWRWLRNLRSGRYGLPKRAQHAVKSHRTRYVYDGTITTDKILPYLPFGGEWIPVLARHSRLAPCDGRELKVRLYRDWWALRNYHVKNVHRLRERQLSNTGSRP